MNTKRNIFLVGLLVGLAAANANAGMNQPGDVGNLSVPPKAFSIHTGHSDSCDLNSDRTQAQRDLDYHTDRDAVEGPSLVYEFDCPVQIFLGTKKFRPVVKISVRLPKAEGETEISELSTAQQRALDLILIKKIEIRETVRFADSIERNIVVDISDSFEPDTFENLVRVELDRSSEVINSQMEELISLVDFLNGRVETLSAQMEAMELEAHGIEADRSNGSIRIADEELRYIPSNRAN